MGFAIPRDDPGERWKDEPRLGSPCGSGALGEKALETGGRDYRLGEVFLPSHPGSGLKQQGLWLTLLALALLMSSGVTAHKVQQGILVVTTGVVHDHAAQSLAIHLLELTLDKV